LLDDLAVPELTRAQFLRVSSLLHDACGIALRDGKENLVRSRLLRRLRALALESFEEYLTFLQKDLSGRELTTMIDVLTTNQTSFFREPEHFVYLRDVVVPRLRGEGVPIRFWSAGCSSGEEPFSIGIALREALPDLDRRDARILATDISTRILASAREATYEADSMAELSADLRLRYFEPVVVDEETRFRVKESVRRLVSFARLNLQADWPMRGPFDAIFCRNVMIYFDGPTRERLVNRFHGLLRPGGQLFLGSSESLSGFDHPFRYVQPAVYLK
jgi:chemotaxis protein methyltransferase CheR